MLALGGAFVRFRAGSPGISAAESPQTAPCPGSILGADLCPDHERNSNGSKKLERQVVSFPCCR